MSLRWHYERLRAMSPREIATRAHQTFAKRGWRTRRSWPVPAPKLASVDPWQLPALAADPALLTEAEAYLRGDYRLLNLAYHEPSLDWHLDPQTGVRGPLGFGPDLDYRDPAIAGNVKNTWEKNRHHHLTVLALAYAHTQDERYAREVEAQLRDWVAANPFPLGLNWTSMLELGIRLIAWVWVERLLRGSASHAALFGKQGLLWQPIYQHQWLMARLPSSGSSANNHLLGEVAGAYMAALLWPCFDESPRWRAHAREVLEREIALQTFPDGLNREQAMAYHLFSLELFLLPALEGERLGQPFSPGYKHWLARQLLVLPRLCDEAGNLPGFGDEDGGLGVQLRAQSASRLDWLYGLGRSFLGLPLPHGSDVSLLWDRAKSAPPPLPRPTGCDAFPDAGVYILANAQGLRCVADAGPLGYLSIAGHGHADALSFSLGLHGKPVIVDPGTYVYHADPQRRAYFRGTRAHNTITVDGEDQTAARGPFLWARRQARTRVLHWSDGRLLAEHDGYTRLPGKVVHRREWRLAGRTLTVTDRVTGQGVHRLEWRLHFAPGCQVELAHGRCSADGLAFACDPRFRWSLESGWYSAGFNLIEPCHTLVGFAELELPLDMTIEFNHSNINLKVQVSNSQP